VARQSVNVNAIAFWLVWNAEKSILEGADFIEAITLNAHRSSEKNDGLSSARFDDRVRAASLPPQARKRSFTQG